MKQGLKKGILLLVGLIAIPTFYNSCQKSLTSASSSTAKKSCKITMENGQYQKKIVDHDEIPEAFSTGKVQLRKDASRSQGQMFKASGPSQIPKGSSLAVLINNSCLEEKASAVPGFFSQFALDSGQRYPLIRTQAYRWNLDRDYLEGEIEELADQDTCVVGLSWNHKYKLSSVPPTSDPIIAEQRTSHLNSIRAMDSYPLFYNSSGAATGGMKLSGTPILVAVVDTGLDWQHPDLKTALRLSDEGFGLDVTTLGSNLIDYNPFDISYNGHGTHVAGLIAAVSNNGLGGIGVMPYRAQILALKIFSWDDEIEDVVTDTTILSSAIQVAYLNDAAVINLSLGSQDNGPASDSMIESSIQNAVTNGSLVVVVTGNADGDQPAQELNGSTFTSIPGIYANKTGVIGVGSIDAATGNKSSFSHFSKVYGEIAAPGNQFGDEGMVSTLPQSLGNYGRLSGTSQAAPLVSAAAALTMGLIRENYGSFPSPAEVESLILQSAQKSASLKAFFKDGNRLDLVSLAALINTKYPNTKTGAPIPPPPVSCN